MECSSECDLEYLEDCEIAFMIILKHLNDQINIKGVFISQIKTIVKDHSDVSEQVTIMRNSKKYKLLNCKNYGLDEFFLITQTQYTQDLSEYTEKYESGCRKFIHYIKSSSVISASRVEFGTSTNNDKDDNAMNDEEVNAMVESGFLSRRRDCSDDFYYLSHPKV